MSSNVVTTPNLSISVMKIAREPPHPRIYLQPPPNSFFQYFYLLCIHYHSSKFFLDYPFTQQLTSSSFFIISGSECEDSGASPPLELRRATDSPAVATLYVPRHLYYDGPPPAHRPSQPRLQVATPPHASQVPPQADSLLILLQVCKETYFLW